MSVESFIRAMPKVELHVHLEGAIAPATLLELAQRHQVALPASTVEGLREWYTFTDFDHFLDVYMTVSGCIRTPDDIELIAREFLAGQAAQNILYSEVTYTAYTHYAGKGIAWADQLAALNRARRWAESELGVSMGLIIDIARQTMPEEGLVVADWAIAGMSDGVVALGLGGPEVGHPPEKFTEAFQRARDAGLPSVPHAGEIAGPDSIWGALRALHAVRIGHGIHCLEDPILVEELRAQQIPLEVSPTSNVCLKQAPDMAGHPFERLRSAGLCVTVNSDDPTMFNTTLTDEYLALAQAFGYGESEIAQLVLNGVRALLLPAEQRATLERLFVEELGRVQQESPSMYLQPMNENALERS
jgi:adenosine deaminase